MKRKSYGKISGQTRKLKLFYVFARLPILSALGGAFVGIVFKLTALGNFRNYLIVTLGLTAAGFVFGIFIHLHHRFMPVGDLDRCDKLS